MLQESSPIIAKLILVPAEPTPCQTSASSVLQFLRKFEDAPSWEHYDRLFIEADFKGKAWD